MNLQQVDIALFRFINITSSNPLFNFLMPVLRNKYTWGALYLFLIVFFIRQYNKAAAWLIGGMLLSFALADRITAGFIKPLVHRPRPCSTPALQLIARISCGTGYSFPSSHASNHFAIAVFLIATVANKSAVATWLLILWAFSISYAQVYVGVHFPSDVFGGAVIGSIVGLICARALFALKPFQRIWNSGR